jgi:hypothetical protein
VSESNGQDPGETPPGSLETAAAILSLAYALASVLWLLWIMVPESTRRLWLMRVVHQMRGFLGRAAFRAGHQAMGLEISGHGVNYALPLTLSVARDKAAAVYERLRYSP